MRTIYLDRRKVIPTALLLGAMFLLGRTAAEVYREEQAQRAARETTAGVLQSDSAALDETADSQDFGSVQSNGAALDETADSQVSGTLQDAENWGLGFGKKAGEKPTGNASVEAMKQYNAYYMREGDEKVLYLTFDCGYENGNTEPILDALKKHSAPATFFVVGHYLETAPEIVKRMAAEGHTVGNHTYHHYDMSKISDKASFEKEMSDVAALYKEITGAELALYYRPPQGKYSTANLQMAKEMGYATFFWSLAYVDWNQDDQPDPDAAIKKLTDRVHPGAVVLLHSTSKTNAEILDELLTKWEKMGYVFRPLSDFLEEEQTAGAQDTV